MSYQPRLFDPWEDDALAQKARRRAPATYTVAEQLVLGLVGAAGGLIDSGNLLDQVLDAGLCVSDVDAAVTTLEGRRRLIVRGRWIELAA